MASSQPDQKPTEQRVNRSAVTERSSSDPLLGRVLKGRFVLEQALGRGGMSIVYKALDLNKQAYDDPQPYVAVKLLTDAMIRHNPKAVVALQREASRTQKLSHDNIVKVWDFDSEGDLYFIMMEWLQGESLDSMLKSRSEGLPRQRALRLLEQLCSGLSYAHERGLVHSDLKPGNVFVNAEGVLKILDFGIATPLRALDTPGTLYDPRQQTLRALTPSHASPEQWQALPADPKDDIYSLGCIAYELLSGQHPFGGADALKASGAGMTVAPLRTLTRAQNAALRRALSFKRADRTASAEVFLQEMLQTGRTDRRRAVAAIFAVLCGVAATYALMEFRGRPEDASRTQAVGALQAAEEQAAKEEAEKKAAAERAEAQRVAAAREAAAEQAAREAAEKKATADKAAREKALAVLRLAEFVDIPGDEFQMGDLRGDGDSDEKPVHGVRIKAFRLGRTAVTFAQYDAFARATSRGLPDDEGWGRGQRPAINVRWQDAKDFIGWLNERTGQRFRLPSEAEWEYAARRGTTTRYPWGDDFDAKQANGNVNVGKTTEVGQYPPNAFGLYDMIGNVWQWTEDCYHESYSGAPPDGSAWTAGDCARRVLRGGSWFGGPADLRASSRRMGAAAGFGSDVGFRLAQDR